MIAPVAIPKYMAVKVREMYEAAGEDGMRTHTVDEIANAFKVTRSTAYRSLQKTSTPLEAGNE